jgi:hypothetical protein
MLAMLEWASNRPDKWHKIGNLEGDEESGRAARGAWRDLRFGKKPGCIGSNHQLRRNMTMPAARLLLRQGALLCFLKQPVAAPGRLQDAL